MTTDTEALATLVAHHLAMDEAVQTRAAAISRAVGRGSSPALAVAEFVAYFADEVLPHTLAEEQTVYQAARLVDDLVDVVAEMILEHRDLVASIETFVRSSSARDQAEEAWRVTALFSAHVTKENDVLLARLVADDRVDVAALLDQMQDLVEANRVDRSLSDDASEVDTAAAVLRLLLDALRALADAGRGERACRLAATAWASLRLSRPDLAVRTTAALHALAKRVSNESDAAARPGDERAGSPSPNGAGELDVRSLAPQQRHESIFATYEGLPDGSAFVLVNDHDPKPLRYQFEAEHAGAFAWDSLEEGPEVWRVRISKQRSTKGPEPTDDDSTDEPEHVLDVRRLVHGRRHEIIFATYAALAAENGFVLVNDHDPKPLRYQFEAQHEGKFTWEYLEAGPEVWRVRVTKALV